MIADGEDENNVQTVGFNKDVNIYFNNTGNEYTIDANSKIYNIKKSMKIYVYREFDETTNSWYQRVIGTLPSTNFDEISLKLVFNDNEEETLNMTKVYGEITGLTEENIVLPANRLGAYALLGYNIPSANSEKYVMKVKYSLKSRITGEWIESEELIINNFENIHEWGNWY